LGNRQTGCSEYQLLTLAAGRGGGLGGVRGGDRGTGRFVVYEGNKLSAMGGILIHFNIHKTIFFQLNYFSLV